MSNVLMRPFVPVFKCTLPLLCLMLAFAALWYSLEPERSSEFDDLFNQPSKMEVLGEHWRYAYKFKPQRAPRTAKHLELCGSTYLSHASICAGYVPRDQTMHNFEHALADLRKSCELKCFTDPTLVSEYAECLSRIDHFQGKNSERCLEALKGLSAGIAFNVVGNEYFRRGDYAEAVSNYDKAFEKARDERYGPLILGIDTHRWLHFDNPLQERIYLLSVRWQPEDRAYLHYNRGRALLKCGKVEEAATDFDCIRKLGLHQLMFTYLDDLEYYRYCCAKSRGDEKLASSLYTETHHRRKDTIGLDGYAQFSPWAKIESEHLTDPEWSAGIESYFSLDN